MTDNWESHWSNNFRIQCTKLGFMGNCILNHQLSKLIFDTSSEIKSSIEIGAGSGKLSSFLSRKIEACVILDKSMNALNIARKVNKKNPNTKFIQSDIFDYKDNCKYDIVVSAGLVEHFNKRKMNYLIEKHLSFTKKTGKCYIAVPSYSDIRAIIVKEKKSLKKYGWQDAKAEFIIEEYLNNKGINHVIEHLDYIGSLDGYLKYLKFVNILTYVILRIDLNKYFLNRRGNYTLFIIDGNANKKQD